MKNAAQLKYRKVLRSRATIRAASNASAVLLEEVSMGNYLYLGKRKEERGASGTRLLDGSISPTLNWLGE